MQLQTLKTAFEAYQAVKDKCSASGDWSAYADLFAEVSFVDHHGMGRFEGRKGIREYITKAMMPFPNMTFPIDWIAYDLRESAVVFQVQNAFPAPPVNVADGGKPFMFPNWTRVVFDAASGKWRSEETVYNPARDAGRTLKAWRIAGGKFQSPEQLRYKYATYPDKAKL
jgi:hypothetical protein